MLLKKLICSAPFRYFAVSACGFFIDFLVYAVIVAAGQSIYLANVIGFCVGASVNVLLIRRFVFMESRHSLLTDILLTIAANGMILFMGLLLLWFQVERMRLDPYIAKLIANGVTFALNYVTRAYYFSRK